MNELLRALAENDREKQAPEAVELRLRAAFRRRYSHPKWPYAVLAIAAALVLAIQLIPKQQTIQFAVVTPPVPDFPAVKPVVHRKRTPPREVVTEFYPLMEDAPFERGELLRVSLPAETMRSVGLPVSEERLGDTVQADVLVGEEGLARAIRFVVNRP